MPPGGHWPKQAHRNLVFHKPLTTCILLLMLAKMFDDIFLKHQRDSTGGDLTSSPQGEGLILNKSLFSVNLQPGICWAGSQNQNESKFSCVLMTQDAELETTLGATRPVTEPKNQFEMNELNQQAESEVSYSIMSDSKEPMSRFSCFPVLQRTCCLSGLVSSSIGTSVSSLYWNFKHVPGQLGTICRSSR